MNTLFTTNILLLVIVAAILVMTVLTSILLIHLIGTTRRIKDIVKTFDDDVHRARSVVLALKEIVSEKVFGKKKKLHDAE